MIFYIDVAFITVALYKQSNSHCISRDNHDFLEAANDGDEQANKTTHESYYGLFKQRQLLARCEAIFREKKKQLFPNVRGGKCAY